MLVFSVTITVEKRENISHKTEPVWCCDCEKAYVTTTITIRLLEYNIWVRLYCSFSGILTPSLVLMLSLTSCSTCGTYSAQRGIRGWEGTQTACGSVKWHRHRLQSEPDWLINRFFRPILILIYESKTFVIIMRSSLSFDPNTSLRQCQHWTPKASEAEFQAELLY